MPKLEIPHKIISLNVLATGRMILTTENRVYESLNDVWTPMKFADDPEPQPVTDPAPPSPVESTLAPAPSPPLFAEPAPETHS
jgi:hypothetical protein